VTAPFGRSHELDFLRGLAIVSVLASHVSQAFPSGLRIVDFVFSSGWVGANVFYFVSALTMCLMWTQREGESHPASKFYIRSFLRIAPLFWLAIPLYLALNGTGPSYDAPNGIGPVQVILTALFLHGFWPDSINSVVPGDWSIAAEMTFYLVFPFVIEASARAAISIWRSRSSSTCSMFACSSRRPIRSSSPITDQATRRLSGTRCI
jgi:peptidoglycan/LPS O-acetylase OafA/YrhL